MIEWLHPAALFIVAAAVVPFVRGNTRVAIALGASVVAGGVIAMTSAGVYGQVPFLGMELVLGRVDALSRLFATIFVIMAFIGNVYALHVHRRDAGQQVAALLYVGGALGVALAGDLLTLFMFSELMAFGSLYLIWARRQPASTAAGYRYILVHIFAGVCIFGGVVIRAVETGSLAFDRMTADGVGTILILVGFLTNAAVPPLHAWLADAYPEATVTGAVFLSAFTTKTAVYTLIRGFAGTEILAWLGVIMVLYGVVYAVLENDIRRLLGYHIISQVGYMVAGVGIGTELALNGASAHAFAHILYKGLLFMGAGAVIEMTGRRKLTDLGGLYKTMPLTLTLYMIGGVSISALPLFSGFVSKSIVVASAAEDHRIVIWLLLMLASSGTFLSTTLKLPYYAWFGKDTGLRASEPPKNMLVGMGLAAGLCILIGVWPGSLYALLPYAMEFHPYTAHHLSETMQILMFTLLGFLLLLAKLGPERVISLDTDWFYRKGGRAFLWLAQNPVNAADAWTNQAYTGVVLRPARRIGALLASVDKNVVDGVVNAVGRVTQGGAAGSTAIEKYVIYGSLNLIGYGSHLAAASWRRLQSGMVHHYAAILLGGLFILANLYFLFLDHSVVARLLGYLQLAGNAPPGP